MSSYILYKMGPGVLDDNTQKAHTVYFLLLVIVPLTHWGLVMQYGIREHGQHWCK